MLLAVSQSIDFVMPEHPFPLGSLSHVLLLIAFAWIARAIWTRAETPAVAAVPVPA